MKRPPAVDTEVLIVGAGMAGLYVAYRLAQANIPFIVLEVDDHAGGRVYSRPEKHTHLGLVLDEGANLINSTDSLAIRLMDKFDINYVRRLKRGSDGMHYFYNGVEYDQAGMDALLFQDSRIAINHILHDQDIWRADKNRDFDIQFISESIAAYLVRVDAGPALKTMLKAFFWSEYGKELENLNLHVLFDYLEIDLSCPCFKLIPNVDEAYTVPHGLGQIAQHLEQLCHDRILYARKVTRITEKEDHLEVQFQGKAQTAEVLTAHHVFFAAPLHSLKDIDISVQGLSAAAIDQARLASYARGTKLHLKFEDGFDHYYKYSGILLTDTGEQIWPSSTGQGGAGLLTVLTGPLPPGRAIAVEQAGHVLRLLDGIIPNLSDHYVGVERSDAPMSYSGSLMPGEVAHLRIHEGAAHWTTVGEASSPELQGYLEGALRSAEVGVMRYVIAKRGRISIKPSVPIP